MRGLLSVSGSEVNTLTSSNGTDPAQQDKKPMAETDLKETEEPLFEIVIAHGKGLGLFATRDISRGTRIIEEAPLLTVPPQKGKTDDSTHLVAALQALSHEQYDKVFELHRGHKAALPKDLPSQQPGRTLSREDILNAAAIFETNNVAMGNAGEYGSGIFEHYCRINHACNPNVHNSYNPTLQQMSVHAVRQIHKGEEILTSYIAGTYLTREKRQQILSKWGFECCCNCCIGPRAAASDRRRSRMFDMDQKLKLYNKSIRLPWLRTLSSPRAALRVCEDLLELYMLEGITDFSLSLLYRECSGYSLESGQFDKAVNYARKERKVARYCLGTDNSPSVKGADYWLQHVLDEREAYEKVVKEKVAREIEMAQPKKKGDMEKKKRGKGKKKRGKGRKKRGKGRKK